MKNDERVKFLVAKAIKNDYIVEKGEIMDFTFLWPYALGALLLPILVRLFFSSVQMLPYGQALCVPFFDVIQKNLKKTVGPYKKRSSPFFILAYLFLTVAAMRPVFYAQPIYIPSTGRQMMLVLDVSGSMAEQDFVYNNRRSTRLGVVQNVAQDFIKSRQGDAVGLTIFGSEAFLYTPLTPDTQTASQMLTEIGVGMAGDRTAIGDALLVALKQMKDYVVNTILT
jgi:Ca-activated chloride channel family protein